jgi:membrane protease YdiL (CAAX protease family)
VSPIILLLAVVVGLALFGRPWPWSDLGSVNGLPRMSPLAVWVSLTLLNGFGEETGWRGFALPLLQERYGALGGTLLLAALWGSWHAPMFFVLDTYRALGPAMLPGFFLGLAAGAVLLTWLYNRSGGSVIAVAVWHGCFNFATATRAAQGIVAAVVSTTVMVWGIALTVLDVRARRRGARSVLA